jgi:hypothetical protein
MTSGFSLVRITPPSPRVLTGRCKGVAGVSRTRASATLVTVRARRGKASLFSSFKRLQNCQICSILELVEQ